MHKFIDISEFIHFLESELILSSGEVLPESEIRSLRTWSSLNALILISRVNDETDVLITAGDLANCTTVTDLYQLISSK